MDKYEFNIKVEQIKKLVNKKDYPTAMKIADTIDWKRVRNVKLLTLIAQVYEFNSDYQESKDILLLAYERAPIGKRLVYKLTELAIKEGHISEADSYFEEFVSLAPNDARQYLLRYLIEETKGAQISELISLLEAYKQHEFEEKWSYELAQLYHRAGREEDCIRLCDDIMLWFSFGKYVEKAMELKTLYQPLTDKQQELYENKEKYEEKVKEVERAFSVQEMAATALVEEIPIETVTIVQNISISTDLQELYEMPESISVLPLDNEIAVRLEEEEVEVKLAEEMSKISIEEYQEEDSFATKEMPTIRRSSIKHETETIDIPPMENISPVFTVQEELHNKPEQAVSIEPESLLEPMEETQEFIEEEIAQKKCFIIKAAQSREGIKSALELIRQINTELGTKSQVVKISGAKLNNRGVLASMPLLIGRDLIIEQAYDLNDMMLEELKTALYQDQEGKIIVLVDTPERINSLYVNHPNMNEITECITLDDMVNSIPQVEPIKKETLDNMKPIHTNVQPQAEIKPETNDSIEKENQSVNEVMELDGFIQFACDFARDLDCIIEEMAILALYAKAEEMLAEGITLTRIEAENIVDNAIEKAEKRTVGKLISGVFSSKYNKEGLLLLKEAHFKE